MSVLSEVRRFYVRCDECRHAYTFVDNDVEPGLVDAGWSVHGGRHMCPRCVRKATQ
jgi:hypothetical protein